MPWTVADVASKTKKAKTTAQKKKWVSIANGVLKDCQAKGGSDCEGKAIRIANSKFSEDTKMSKEAKKIPMGAMRFVATESHAFTEFSEDGEKKVAKMNMTAYSGKIIKNHYWWNDLAIDLSGMVFDKSKYPVLENHDQSRKIAFTAKPIITDDFKLKLDPEKTAFVGTEESAEFQKLSSEGFPFESSVYVTPLSVERLDEGITADVNGYKMKGPGTIFRKSRFNEASVCVFGWDRQTQAAAFSKEEVEVDFDETVLEDVSLTNNREEVKKLEITNVNQLTEAHPDLVKQIQDAVKSEMEAAFSKEREQLTNDIASRDEIITSQNERILKLEKNDTIRTERELKSEADSIFASKLSDSDIPEHLYGKVRSQVNHIKFVKDGILDKEAFATAVDAEIKDWVDKGVVSSVMGTGFSSKAVDNTETSDEVKVKEQNASIVKNMLASVGVKPKEAAAAGQ